MRAASSLLITASCWTRIVVFVVAGLLRDAPLLVLAALMIPVMFAGRRFGNRLHYSLSGPDVLRLVSGLLVVNGILLIARATTG